MNFSWSLYPLQCDLCQENFRMRYQCMICNYFMCYCCYQKYLQFKFNTCPQCREVFVNLEDRRKGDDIVPSITNCTLRNYFKIYLVSILAAGCYWLFNIDNLGIFLLSYLFFFLIVNISLFIFF